MPNWDISRGFLSVYISFIKAEGISAAAIGRGRGHYIFCVVFLYIICRKDQRSCDGQDGGLEHNMINYMTIRELLYYTFGDFFPKLEFLFIILILPKGTAKLRWGGGDNIFFRV